MPLRLIGVDARDFVHLRAVSAQCANTYFVRRDRLSNMAPIGHNHAFLPRSTMCAPSALDSQRFRGKYAVCDLAVFRVRRGDHISAIYGGGAVFCRQECYIRNKVASRPGRVSSRLGQLQSTVSEIVSRRGDRIS